MLSRPTATASTLPRTRRVGGSISILASSFDRSVCAAPHWVVANQYLLFILVVMKLWGVGQVSRLMPVPDAGANSG